MRGEVLGGAWLGMFGVGRSMGEVSGGEWEWEGEGRGTYTPISTLPLNNIKVHPKQLWPKQILGLLPEVGVD